MVGVILVSGKGDTGQRRYRIEADGHERHGEEHAGRRAEWRRLYRSQPLGVSGGSF